MKLDCMPYAFDPAAVVSVVKSHKRGNVYLFLSIASINELTVSLLRLEFKRFRISGNVDFSYLISMSLAYDEDELSVAS